VLQRAEIGLGGRLGDVRQLAALNLLKTRIRGFHADCCIACRTVKQVQRLVVGNLLGTDVYEMFVSAHDISSMLKCSVIDC